MIIILGKDRLRVRLAALTSWTQDFERIWTGRTCPGILADEYIQKRSEVAKLREIFKIAGLPENGEKK